MPCDRDFEGSLEVGSKTFCEEEMQRGCSGTDVCVRVRLEGSSGVCQP